MNNVRALELGEVGLTCAPMATLGQQIKAARERAHLSGTEFARRMGVSKNTVSNWERGSAPKSRLAAIADVLPTFDPSGTVTAPSLGERYLTIPEALRAADDFDMLVELMARAARRSGRTTRATLTEVNHDLDSADQPARDEQDSDGESDSPSGTNVQ